ncbi:MAG TPA: mandelate racemase/muconate lactonizing enzyme family protein [Terracidiphilus sp.]|nr:mandelate racemase/muconate lactonizing enzyme family protein [Terracidiphilus sp.]
MEDDDRSTTGSKLTRRGLLGSAGLAGAAMMMQAAAASAQSSGAADVKITSVKATIHNVPVKVPLLNKTVMNPIVFVEISTDAGITGYGLTGDLQVTGVREFINQQLAPFLKGKSALDTEARWQEMFLTFNPRYQTGAFSSAVSAIDIALWDVKGKHLNQPVWRLLGGAKKTVPAYITFGLLDFDRDQLVEFVRRFLADGQDKFKMVVAIDNGENVAEDAARVAAVREAIGPEHDLMIDGNYLFSMNRALQLAKRVEPYNITWFEEPLYGNDARLLAQLRQRCSVPISAGQNEGSRFRHLELLQHGAIDILQPNVCYVGGYTEGMKVAALAQAYNINIADGGGWPHHNMHLQAAASNGWRVEFHYLMWQTGNIIYKNPPQPVKGNVTLTEDPGLGLEPNPDALRESLVR